MKRWLLYAVKLGLGVGILSYLLWATFQAQPEVYSQLQNEEKNWFRLAFAGLLLLAISMVTFFRWYLLVRVLGLTFSLSSAIRLGFVGYFFNFFSLGAVGGDIFKAALLARDQAGHRTEAVISVIMDRLVGFYGLLLLATVAILSLNGLSLQMLHDEEPIRWLFVATLVCFLVANLAICFWRQLWRSRLATKMASIPRLGKYLERIPVTLIVYYRHKGTLALAILLTLLTQAATAVAFWLIATGLPGSGPSLGQFLIIVPLSLVAAAVPLPMGGLGALEAMLAYLYQLFSFSPARGLLVALVYRGVTILIALGSIPFVVRGAGAAEIRDQQSDP